MHPNCCVTEKTRDTYESLKRELTTVTERAKDIANWDLPKDKLDAVLGELERQKSEIKERMHNYIDTL